MSDGRKYYCFCETNCKFETMNKEQILAAIAEATGAAVTDIDAAFITKIKESNANKNTSFWVGTEAEYNAISPAANAVQFIARVDANGKVYICTDDSLVKELQRIIPLVPTKQNQLSWLTAADIDSMWDGSYVGVEDEENLYDAEGAKF